MTGSSGVEPPRQDLEEGPEATSPKVNEFSEGEELQGKLRHSEELDKLMHSVLPNDRDLIEEGTLLAEGINHGLQSFTPDLMFQQLVQNYRHAEQLYGERLIRALSGYDPSYVERNVRIPEFQRQLHDDLKESIKSLKEQGLLDKEGAMTDMGLTVASLSMASDELERMNRKGILGERANKAVGAEGIKADYANFKEHRYHDLNLKASIKKAIRRNHGKLIREDLVAQERENKERATIIYAIDASGSMKGEKIAAAKRAGIALSFKATRKNDLVGITIFGKDVTDEQAPTKDFKALIKTIVQARAAQETNIASTIDHARLLLHNAQGVKHLVILTDGLQTAGDEETVIEAAGKASQERITISIIGLSLDQKGEALSKRIVEAGGGNLYLVKDYDNLDVLIIEDYYRSSRR